MLVVAGRYITSIVKAKSFLIPLLILAMWPGKTNAQWSWDSLSTPRFQPCALTVGSTVWFAGGGKYSHLVDADSVIDIYDDSTGKWSKKYLSRSRYNMTGAVAGDLVFFAGGETGTEKSTYFDLVDIYDRKQGTWSQSRLSVARCELACVVVGSKVLFAGGSQHGRFSVSDVVDIYDTNTKSWSKQNLSAGRNRLAAAAIGTKAFFAGGLKERSSYTDVVDIYDNATGIWSTTQLSEKRQDLAAVVVGNKILFAGGHSSVGESATVDIYDNATGKWSTAKLSVPRFDIGAIAVGKRAFFAGGHTSSADGTSDVVDIYDEVSDTWTRSKLSEPRNSVGVAAVGSKVFFAGGWVDANKGPTKTIDIYHLDAERDVEPPEIEVKYLNEGSSNSGGNVEVEIVITDDSYLSSFKVNGIERFNGKPITTMTLVDEFRPGDLITIEATDIHNLKYKTEKSIPNLPFQSSHTKHRYFALLIAVEKYQDKDIAPLHQPVSDAVKLRSVLIDKYSFKTEDVELMKNPTSDDIQDALVSLRSKVSPEDLLLIFYAGHGYYEANADIGYWLPSDAKKENQARWYRNSALVEDIRAIKSKHTFVIADACFAGAIFTARSAFNNASADISNKLRRVSRKAMTSGALTTVPDKSDFSEYLFKILTENQKTYLDTEELYHEIRERMKNNSDLVPAYGEIRNTGDEGGTFVFKKSSKD